MPCYQLADHKLYEVQPNKVISWPLVVAPGDRLATMVEVIYFSKHYTFDHEEALYTWMRNRHVEFADASR